jgi:hypothetical protein
MKDYQVLEGGSHHAGEEISLTIQPWTDLSADLGSIARGEIFDQGLLEKEPFWGEEDRE